MLDTKEKVYTESDIHCLDNLKWETEQLLTFLYECNNRKVTLFKLALTILSVFFTGFAMYITVSTNKASLPIELEAKVYVCSALLVVSLFVYSIIKEIFSIHISRIQVFMQINSLRQAFDAIRYKKHQGSYPTDCNDFKDTSTAYWKAFGKYRVLDVDNKALKENEQKWYRAPDIFMVGILFISTLIIQLGSTGYLAFSTDTSRMVVFISGIVLALVTIYTCFDIFKMWKKLMLFIEKNG